MAKELAELTSAVAEGLAKGAAGSRPTRRSSGKNFEKFVKCLSRRKNSVEQNSAVADGKVTTHPTKKSFDRRCRKLKFP